MKKILFALAAVVMLAPACTQDLTDGQNGGTVEMKKVTFGVSFEQPEIIGEDGTRITLDEDKKFVWEDGDVVTIVYTPTGGSITSTTATIDGGFAGTYIDDAVPFEFSLPDDGNYTVHYAYSSKCQADQIQDYRLRPRCSVQASDGAEAYEGNTYAAYKESDFDQLIRDCFATGAVNTTDNTITLRNSAAFFQVQLTGNGEAVWSVDVLSKSQNLRARYCYVNNPATDNPTLAIYQTLEATSEGSSAMGGAHCNTSGETLSEAPKSYYFAMPVYDFPAGDLFIQVRTGNYTRLYRASKAHSFKRNHVTVLKPIEVKPIDTDAHDYQPLDTDGLSNCYMVAPSTTEDKYYSFPIKNVNGATEIYNGKTKNYGVWPMWATKDGLVEDISVIYGGGNGENGRVYFKVPAGSGKGSYMLNGGPINSTLIGTNWAWHIWVTDAKAQTYGDPAITVLDRAPGALWVPTSLDEVKALTGETAAQTVGFMYQYGRHIPFPGPQSLNSGNANKWGYEGPAGSGSQARFNANMQHVEYYHFARWQNGFTIYGNTNKDIIGTKYYNMQFMHYNGSWATDVTQASINADGVSGNKNMWSTAEKGNQDPCPQGYRVAGVTELDRIFRNMSADGASLVYFDQWSPAKQKLLMTTGTKGADALGSFVNGDRQAGKGKQLLNGNFLWFPFGGVRMSHYTAERNETGTLLYSTTYMHENDTYLRPAIGIIWGVFDYEGEPKTKLLSQTRLFMPTHNISQYPNYVCCAFKWAMHGENLWAYSSALTSSVKIRNDNGDVKFDGTIGGLPANDAAPVRCIKLPTASGDAEVSSLAAKQTDANAWN